MPKRKESIIQGEIYHAYNKAVGDNNIFLSTFNVLQALKRIRYYMYSQNQKYTDYISQELSVNNPPFIINPDIPLVSIYAYAIMPNHYHFVLKESEENGIRRFISNFQMSYAWLYNKKEDRNGSVFQGRFKIKYITSTEQFIHVVRYVHLNPVTAYMYDFNRLSKSNLTSYYEYLHSKENNIVDTAFVLKQFSNIKSFIDFHKNQVDYQRKIASIKKLLID